MTYVTSSNFSRRTETNLNKDIKKKLKKIGSVSFFQNEKSGPKQVCTTFSFFHFETIWYRATVL